MNPFHFERAPDVNSAVRSATSHSKFLAGGTNLVDLMKNHVEQPDTLIDINRIGCDKIESLPDGGLRLGALARNSDTANHALVRRDYPLLTQAILSAASPQLRNLATNSGNLLQRTRCPYFMDTGFANCNKRDPGSGCGARQGVHRNQAIFGASEQCIATHPSDMCVALAALEAVVLVRGSKGERRIAFADFHRLPGDTPEIETDLQPGELITAIDLPPPRFSAHSVYIKIRDRSSYDFALVSAAVALDLNQSTIADARIVLGSVAAKPWRVSASEKLLIGGPASREAFEAAAAKAISDARPLKENAFKVELARRAIVQGLRKAGGLA